ncbi:hypothetical protein [Rhodopila globiformis]|uniref:hypothetical protein n=1 Tax=Rhodopila globiformis TaxID=1071 RepID=UPI0011B03F51|nr:hypothetical protein [Rhodopila globiformis]
MDLGLSLQVFAHAACPGHDGMATIAPLAGCLTPMRCRLAIYAVFRANRTDRNPFAFVHEYLHVLQSVNFHRKDFYSFRCRALDLYGDFAGASS